MRTGLKQAWTAPDEKRSRTETRKNKGQRGQTGKFGKFEKAGKVSKRGRFLRNEQITQNELNGQKKRLESGQRVVPN